MRIERRLLQLLSSITRGAARRSYGNQGNLGLDSRAIYIGNNHVLVRCNINGLNIDYYVEADDKLISPNFILSGTYEKYLTRYLVNRVKPDYHCVDVGANFGYFTCLMARLCPKGMVIGIEADRRIYDLLRDNIAINNLHHARAFHAAVVDNVKEVTLYRRYTRSGNTSIIPVSEDYTNVMGEPAAQAFSVRGLTVDDIAAELGGRVDVLKVDVEGAEPLVLAGAAQVIKTNPNMTIIMEWSPGQIQSAGFDVGDFCRSLEASGLYATDFQHGRMVSISHDTLVSLPYRPGILLERR